MTDTERNLLRMVIDDANTVYKNSVIYFESKDIGKFIRITDELGKDHCICYKKTNKDWAKIEAIENKVIKDIQHARFTS